MANTKNVCILGWAVCDLGEGWDSSVAGEFEDMGRILNNYFLLVIASKKS
jgi:hypothetical protein